MVDGEGRVVMKGLALVVGVGMLAVGACGGDDDDGGDDVSSGEQPYVDAMAESFTAADEGDLVLTDDQAACVAPRWVSTIGLERFEATGVTPENLDANDDLSTYGLTEIDGNELYDAFGECDVDVRELFLADLAVDQNLSDEDAACLGESFDDDLLRRVLVASIVEGDDAMQENDELMSSLLAAFSECPGALPDG